MFFPLQINLQKVKGSKSMTGRLLSQWIKATNENTVDWKFEISSDKYVHVNQWIMNSNSK